MVYIQEQQQNTPFFCFQNVDTIVIIAPKKSLPPQEIIELLVPLSWILFQAIQ